MSALPPPTVPDPHFAARIFVDTSASVGGFFGPKTQGAAAVHAELETAIAEVGLGTPKRCTVGADIDCATAPQTAKGIADAKIYKAGVARLDRVLARVAPPARIDPNHPPEPDLLDDARVTVIVTDGMQAAGAGAGDTGCARGPDPGCIRALLQARIAEGYGAWLIGARLAFAGRHYTERTITDAYYAQVKTHVGELKYDPHNLGVQFAVDAKLTLGRDATHSYGYKGVKPLVLLVLSRDAEVGRRLTNGLVEHLQRAPLQPGTSKPEDAIRSLELAPLSAQTVHGTEIVMVPPATQRAEGIQPGQLAEARLEGAAPSSDGLSAKIWCGVNGAALLDVRYDIQPGPASPLVRESIELVPRAAVAGVLAPPHAVTAGTLRTGVKCAALPKGHTELVLALQTRVAVDASAPAAAWVSEWSAVDSWSMPERIYGLADLVQPVLQERAKHSTSWGIVHLHIQRD